MLNNHRGRAYWTEVEKKTMAQVHELYYVFITKPVAKGAAKTPREELLEPDLTEITTTELPHRNQALDSHLPTSSWLRSDPYDAENKRDYFFKNKDMLRKYFDASQHKCDYSYSPSEITNRIFRIHECIIDLICQAVCSDHTNGSQQDNTIAVTFSQGTSGKREPYTHPAALVLYDLLLWVAKCLVGSSALEVTHRIQYVQALRDTSVWGGWTVDGPGLSKNSFHNLANLLFTIELQMREAMKIKNDQETKELLLEGLGNLQEEVNKCCKETLTFLATALELDRNLRHKNSLKLNPIGLLDVDVQKACTSTDWGNVAHVMLLQFCQEPLVQQTLRRGPTNKCDIAQDDISNWIATTKHFLQRSDNAGNSSGGNDNCSSTSGSTKGIPSTPDTPLPKLEELLPMLYTHGRKKIAKYCGKEPAPNKIPLDNVQATANLVKKIQSERNVSEILGSWVACLTALRGLVLSSCFINDLLSTGRKNPGVLDLTFKMCDSIKAVVFQVRAYAEQVLVKLRGARVDFVEVKTTEFFAKCKTLKYRFYNQVMPIQPVWFNNVELAEEILLHIKFPTVSLLELKCKLVAYERSSIPDESKLSKNINNFFECVCSSEPMDWPGPSLARMVPEYLGNESSVSKNAINARPTTAILSVLNLPRKDTQPIRIHQLIHEVFLEIGECAKHAAKKSHVKMVVGSAAAAGVTAATEYVIEAASSYIAEDAAEIDEVTNEMQELCQVGNEAAAVEEGYGPLEDVIGGFANIFGGF